MAERYRHYSEGDLSSELRALADRVVYPPTPDLATQVRRELQTQPAAGREPWWTPLLQRRQLATIAVVILLLAALVVAAIPGARTTIADWIGLPGVTFVESPPEATPTTIGRFFLIGVPRTLDQARAEVDFTILTPTQAGLEEPDEVWVDPYAVGGAVSFVYHPTDEIPEASETGAGLLISQFNGRLNPNLYGKGIGGGVTVERMTINGDPAIWVDGDPHSFTYTNPNGELVNKPTRLAGNTLLWQQGNLTLRLESALDRDSAVVIAESMQ